MNQDADNDVERQLEEALEIVELQEKLDMTFDPLAIGRALKPDEPPPNTNCHNSGCC